MFTKNETSNLYEYKNIRFIQHALKMMSFIECQRRYQII